MATKIIFMLASILALTACSNGVNRKSVDASYSSIPSDKGLVAFRVGQRAVEESGVLSNMPTMVGYGRKMSEEELKERDLENDTYDMSRVIVKGWDFVELPSGNYQKKDFLIEEMPGSYKVAPPMVAGRLPVKPTPIEFTVKPGQITYIGQYDIGTIHRDRLIGAKLKKTTLHISEGDGYVIEEILASYPELSGYKVSNQAPKEAMTFRTRDVPRNTVIHIYPTTYR